MEWADDTIIRLRELWSEGYSTAEIGRRLGVSKNAVVGKAHRLELTPRPSPIRREGDSLPSRRSILRREGPTLPPLPCTTALTPPLPALPSLPVAAPAPAPVAPPVSVAPAPQPAPPPRPIPAPPRLQAVPPPPRSYGRIATCCWPIGEPGTRSFHFCDDPSEPGKPYCEAHAKLAYVKVRDRREDAA